MKYTAEEVAQFLKLADFTYSKERAMIKLLYPSDTSFYEKKVDAIIELLVEGQHLTKNQEVALWSYFKVIKLRLMYHEDCDFIRIKLRTVLKEFNYKRRSEKLVRDIEHILQTLQLETYLKGYVLCSIKEIDLDDFVMIRLKSNL